MSGKNERKSYTDELNSSRKLGVVDDRALCLCWLNYGKFSCYGALPFCTTHHVTVMNQRGDDATNVTVFQKC